MQRLRRFPKILTGGVQLGPYPMEKLNRVDQPTIIITDNVERFRRISETEQPGQAGQDTPAPERGAQRKSSPLGSAIQAAYRNASPPGDRARREGPGASSLDSSLVTGEAGAVKTASPEEMATLLRQMPLIDEKVAPTKAPIPQDPAVLNRHIKSLGYFLGADVMGICRLPQYAVYSHDQSGKPIELNHQNAICIVVDQHKLSMNGSRGDDWLPGPGRAYAISTFISKIMADYIRKLGYPARTHSSGTGYQVLVGPLLILSGIGEMSRAHIVLNPFLGLRYKVAIVTTDMPLEPDKPVDFGLQDFCEKCKTCAIDCPSKSISMDSKVMQNGYENWAFNGDTCRKYRTGLVAGAACGRCIKVCPWNKPEGWTHDLVRWMIQHTPFMNSFFIKMDEVWGYEKQKVDYKWWFDLEEQDGKLQIPNKSIDYIPE